jgi:hypothetical protein
MKWVEQLPCYAFQPPRSAHAGADADSGDHHAVTCLVCLESYQSGEPIRILPCTLPSRASARSAWGLNAALPPGGRVPSGSRVSSGAHQFHRDCVDPWISRNVSWYARSHQSIYAKRSGSAPDLAGGDCGTSSAAHRANLTWPRCSHRPTPPTTRRLLGGAARLSDGRKVDCWPVTQIWTYASRTRTSKRKRRLGGCTTLARGDYWRLSAGSDSESQAGRHTPRRGPSPVLPTRLGVNLRLWPAPGRGSLPTGHGGPKARRQADAPAAATRDGAAAATGTGRH